MGRGRVGVGVGVRASVRVRAKGDGEGEERGGKGVGGWGLTHLYGLNTYRTDTYSLTGRTALRQGALTYSLTGLTCTHLQD